MRHADFYALDAVPRALPDQPVQPREQRLAALKAEALAGWELARQETLEGVCLVLKGVQTAQV
jgi:hypothetical protein